MVTHLWHCQQPRKLIQPHIVVSNNRTIGIFLTIVIFIILFVWGLQGYTSNVMVSNLSVILNSYTSAVKRQHSHKQVTTIHCCLRETSYNHTVNIFLTISISASIHLQGIKRV